MSAAVAAPPQLPKSDVSNTSKEADYEDDFEDFDKELDSFIEEKEKPEQTSDNKSSTEPKQLGDSSEVQPEKGTEEIEKGQKEYPNQGVADPPEGDDYTFSDDQKRAMMELIAQRQENDFPEEDPPEYDVKDRLIQLNAELAQESAPAEREHKVGFKETLVDLVAPPPDFSDDEDSQRDKVSPRSPRDEVDSSRTGNQTNQSGKEQKKTAVVERDGKFEVVNIDDLTASERQLLIVDETESSPRQKEPKKSVKNANNSNIHAKSKEPAPPRQPRPATANGHTNRRALRPLQNKQRPRSAASQPVSNSSSLNNFDYDSPYGLTSEQKQQARERKKVLEEHKQQEERRKKEEKDAERKENEEAFQAWLKNKREEDRKKREMETEEKRKQAKEDKEGLEDDTDSSTKRERARLEKQAEESGLKSFEPIPQKEHNEEAYRAWLKEKRVQLRRERLLKKRQQQEMNDGYHTISREDCDKAFKEWMKKKSIEVRQNKAAENQKSKAARTAAKRSRKAANLLRAIRNSQSFKYVDYYGYQF